MIYFDISNGKSEHTMRISVLENKQLGFANTLFV